MLWAHILQKGYQGGSVLGAGAVVPALAAWQVLKEKQERPDLLKLAQGAAFTTLAALGATFVVGSLKLIQMDRAGMEDRVYRLHYNKGQQRTDTFAQVGSALGLAAAAALFRDNKDAKPLHYLGGASVGAAGGILLHVLTRPAEFKAPNKMIHELVN